MISKFICILLLCAQTIYCYTIVVEQNFLPEDGKILAIGLAEDALLNNYSNRDVAKRLSDEFNKFYGTKWLAFVGPQGIDTVVTQLDMVSNTLLWFSIDLLHVVLFKTTSNNTVITTTVSNTTVCTLNQTSFTNLMSVTKTGELTYNYSNNNNTRLKELVPLIRDAAKNNQFTDCVMNFTNNWQSILCFSQMAYEIKTAVLNRFGGIWTVFIQVINYGAIPGSVETNDTFYDIVFDNRIDYYLIETK